MDLIRRSVELVEAGADAILTAPAIQAQDVVQSLRRQGLECPIVVHNACQTNASRIPTFGVALDVWVLMQRLIGADAIVLPSAYGSFGFRPEETRLSADACSRELPEIRQSLAMHSGSASSRNAQDLLALSDAATAVTSGSGIFDHPSGPRAGAAVLRSIVEPGWHSSACPLHQIRQGLVGYADV